MGAPTQARIELVENALTELLLGALTGVDVASISAAQFTEDNRLVPQRPPCIYVAWQATQDLLTADGGSTAYSTSEQFDLWCCAQNLRPDGQVSQIYDAKSLASDVRAAVVGQMLQINVNDPTETVGPVTLNGAVLAQHDDRCTCIVVRVVVDSITQFTVQQSS